ncbi:MAG: TfoX/Sxy family protein [Candidatus Glassbacteria bacterium]
MTWEKPDPGLIHLLEEALVNFDCEMRKMFGCPAWFAPNGQMFSGVFQSVIFARLSEEDREKLMAKFAGVAPFEPMQGRPMREYMVLPDRIMEHGIRLTCKID